MTTFPAGLVRVAATAQHQVEGNNLNSDPKPRLAWLEGVARSNSIPDKKETA